MPNYPPQMRRILTILLPDNKRVNVIIGFLYIRCIMFPSQRIFLLSLLCVKCVPVCVFEANNSGSMLDPDNFFSQIATMSQVPEDSVTAMERLAEETERRNIFSPPRLAPKEELFDDPAAANGA